MPRVSIGMPIYNNPVFLEAALQSLVGQTFTDFELLISDNASPNPQVGEICNRYLLTDSRLRYFRQTRNVGAIENFRYVLEHTNAPLFMWAADDDLWEPTFVERGVAALESDPKKSAWFCQVDNIDDEGMVIGTLPPFTRLASGGDKRAEVRRFLLEPERLGKVNTIYALFRRVALAEPFDIMLHNKEMVGVDHVFVYAFICRYDLAIDPALLFHKRAGHRRGNRAKRPNPFAGRHFAGFSRAAAGTPYSFMTGALLPWRFVLDRSYKLVRLLARLPIYINRLLGLPSRENGR